MFLSVLQALGLQQRTKKKKPYPHGANILVEGGDRVCWEETIPFREIVKGLTEMLMIHHKDEQ